MTDRRLFHAREQVRNMEWHFSVRDASRKSSLKIFNETYSFYTFLHSTKISFYTLVEYPRVDYSSMELSKFSDSRQIFKLDFLENGQLWFSLFDIFSHVWITSASRLTLRRVAEHAAGWKIFYANIRAKSRTFFFRSAIPRRVSVRSCFSAYARVYVCACVPVTRARSLVCLYLCRLVDTVLSRGRVRVEQGAPIRVHVKVDVRTRERITLVFAKRGENSAAELQLEIFAFA